MTTNLLLFIHIIAAATWVGGSMLLFGMGLYFKDPTIQKTIYTHIGPFYGYFQLIWITLLLITGLLLLTQHGISSVLFNDTFIQSDLGMLLYQKLFLVVIVIIATIVHMFIALKRHNQERTQKEKIISRISSMLIFILNFFIIWYAINIADYF